MRSYFFKVFSTDGKERFESSDKAEEKKNKNEEKKRSEEQSKVKSTEKTANSTINTSILSGMDENKKSKSDKFITKEEEKKKRSKKTNSKLAKNEKKKKKNAAKEGGGSFIQRLPNKSSFLQISKKPSIVKKFPQSPRPQSKKGSHLEKRAPLSPSPSPSTSKSPSKAAVKSPSRIAPTFPSKMAAKSPKSPEASKGKTNNKSELKKMADRISEKRNQFKKKRLKLGDFGEVFPKSRATLTEEQLSRAVESKMLKVNDSNTMKRIKKSKEKDNNGTLFIRTPDGGIVPFWFSDKLYESSPDEEMLILDINAVLGVLNGNITLDAMAIRQELPDPYAKLAKLQEGDAAYFVRAKVYSNSVNSIINMIDLNPIVENEDYTRELIEFVEPQTALLYNREIWTKHEPIAFIPGKEVLENRNPNGIVFERKTSRTRIEKVALRGVNPNIQDPEGSTPLILAAEAGYSLIVETLLEQFPTLNIDQTNNLGQTALMKAAIQGRIHCARALLRAGADAYKRDISRGFCALKWADYVGRTEYRHMIKHYMQEAVKPAKKTSVVQMEDLKKLTAVAAVPLLGDSCETVLPQPRVNSAPIPRLEVTKAPEQVGRTQSYGF